MKKGFVAAVLATALAAFGLACSETGGVDINPDRDCDYLVIPGVSEGASFRNWTERDCPVDLSLPMRVIVDFLDQGPGNNFPSEPGTQLSTFILDKYIVTYRNITQDGSRDPSAVPVGFQFTPGAVVGENGSFPATFELAGGPILLESAKTQPPLNNDSFYTTRTDPLSGVVLEAEIVWWGHPVAQPSRECRGTLVFRFTIFDDDTDRELALCEAELDVEGAGG